MAATRISCLLDSAPWLAASFHSRTGSWTGRGRELLGDVSGGLEGAGFLVWRSFFVMEEWREADN